MLSFGGYETMVLRYTEAFYLPMWSTFGSHETTTRSTVSDKSLTLCQWTNDIRGNICANFEELRKVRMLSNSICLRISSPLVLISEIAFRCSSSCCTSTSEKNRDHEVTRSFCRGA
ncbi:unnamed protein product [Musa acuminata subsp. burmannicoides]